MLVFELQIDEFVALATIMHGSCIPGVNLEFGKASAADIATANLQLVKKGLAHQSGVDETIKYAPGLIDAVLTVVDPQKAILVRDVANERSIQFCKSEQQTTSVLVLEQQKVVLCTLTNDREIAEQAIAFLNETADGLIAIATVENSEIVPKAGVKTTGGMMQSKSIDSQVLDMESVESFLTMN